MGFAVVAVEPDWTPTVYLREIADEEDADECIALCWPLPAIKVWLCGNSAHELATIEAAIKFIESGRN